MKDLQANNYLDQFLEMMIVERGASKNTIEAYKADLLHFFRYLNKLSASILDISQDHISKYSACLTEQGLSVKSLSRKISSIRQFFIFLMQERVRSDNPTLHSELPKSGRSLPKALSEEQIDLLISTSYKDESSEGIRTSAMLELLYASGMRITELITLKLSNLERDESGCILQHLIVRGKGNKERLIMLHQKAIEVLNESLKSRNLFIKQGDKTEYLFPSYTKDGRITHLTRQRFGQLLKQLAINANISPNLLSPHKIRHSFASHLLQNGANLRVVQELLGHADIATTQIYTKILPEKATELVFKHHPLRKG